MQNPAGNPRGIPFFIVSATNSTTSLGCAATGSSHARQCFLLFRPKKAAAPSPSSDAGGAAKSHGANSLFCRHPRSPALTGGCFARSPRNGAWSWPGSLFPRVFPPLRLTLASFPRGKGALSALSWQSCVTPASNSWVIYVALLVSWPYNAQNGPRELLAQGSRAHKQNWDLNVI